MAIGSGDIKEKFGTQDTVSAGGGTSAVSDGAYSAAGDAASWTNDDDAPMANALLTMQYASGTLDGDVDLYGRRIDVDSTNDEPQPDASYEFQYLGVFRIDPNLGTSTNGYFGAEIALPNGKASQKWEFYIKNNSGETIASGWTLKVTPKTLGPAS